MTSEDEICKFLKEAVKEEVKAASEYREWAEKLQRPEATKAMGFAPVLVGSVMVTADVLEEIARNQEEHAKDLALRKETLCPGDDPDLSDLSERAKAKLKEIWEAAKKRTKYEAELTSKCRIGAMAESRRTYEETMRKCMVEKKLAPPP